ncbi:sulfatase-like hydrolase/transferase [bacterium]|nr:sulfatase-like hydrolase/transferase [candidate division CSSED10-310 bacterium]
MHKIHRRIFLKGCAVAAGGLGMWACGNKTDPAGTLEAIKRQRIRSILENFPRTRPGPFNRVLLFSIDALRSDVLGCYGSGLDLTPVMDSLARQHAQVFCVTESSFTGESLASMFCSYPVYYHEYAFGFPGRRQVYSLYRQGLFGYQCNAPMFPEILKAHGIQTASLTTNPMVTDFNLINDCNYHLIRKNRVAKVSFENERQTCETYINEFCNWAKDRKEFFGWIHLSNTHEPYFNTGCGPELPEVKAINPPDKSGPEEGARRREYYLSEVAYSDRCVALLFEQLKRHKLDDVLVIVSSDHGESFSDEHGFRNHIASTMGHEINVPMILIHPDFKNWNPPRNQWRSNMDFMPTMLDCFGITAKIQPGAPDFFQPRSEGDILFSTLHYPLAGMRQELTAVDPATHWKLILRDRIDPATRCQIFTNRPPKTWREHLISAFTDQDRWTDELSQADIRADWNTRIEKKYYTRPLEDLDRDAMWEILLFDLDTDPFEKRNIWSEHRDKARTLQKRMETWLDGQLQVRDAILAQSPTRFIAPAISTEEEKELEENLRALGYII